MIAYFWISDTIESIEASVSHKKMSDWIEVRPCQGPGCFKASLSYGPTVKQLAALVDASEECYQDIEVKSLRFYEYGTHIHGHGQHLNTKVTLSANAPNFMSKE